ncbi:WD40/YVTN/BNR-like repeat-containing protein [Armatimonas sp.]|uniref:WD40/YVTN/BNR-like repeat-containing protein n=1 Tax=Armatimonas sp. TaxID=1872638 RepID=UPI00375372FF
MKRQTKPRSVNLTGMFGLRKMPLLSPEMAAAGISPGGEGGQWPRDLVWGKRGELALCIDVGGLYLSSDGGKSWNLSMEGFSARGCNTVAFDPEGTAPMLAVGGNSMDFDPGWLGGKTPHGLYCWRAKESRWEQVVPVMEGTGGRVAYDPYSYGVIPGACTVAYYLTPKSGLFQCDELGHAGVRMKEWRTISDPLGGEDRDAYLRIGPQAGVHRITELAQGIETTRRNYVPGIVWIGGKRGLLASKDGGRTFQRLREQTVHGLDVTDSGLVFVSDAGGVHQSTDEGKTWTTLPGNRLELKGKPVQNIRVSPADPKRLSCWIKGDNYQWVRSISHDGGESWQPITIESKNCVLPNNVRDGYFAWSPTDSNTVFGIGGDTVTKSTDGGKTFRWSANGYNGIMLGGYFNFSTHAPDSVFLAFQDYNAAVTRDNGKTWQFIGNLTFSGPDVSLSDPTNKNILFASNLRSIDGGKTWKPMPGCDGVYTHATGVLVGKKGKIIVLSNDHGATWQRVAEAPGEIYDLAVDPLKPDVLYVGGSADIYATSATVCRSQDVGKTWENLTAASEPREVNAIRVHPKTREVWLNGQCYGMWRLSPI